MAKVLVVTDPKEHKNIKAAAVLSGLTVAQFCAVAAASLAKSTLQQQQGSKTLRP